MRLPCGLRVDPVILPWIPAQVLEQDQIATVPSQRRVASRGHLEGKTMTTGILKARV